MISVMVCGSDSSYEVADAGFLFQLFGFLESFFGVLWGTDQPPAIWPIDNDHGVCSVECCEMFSDRKFPAFLLITGITAPEGLKDFLTIRTVSSDFSNWDLINNCLRGAEKDLG